MAQHGGHAASAMSAAAAASQPPQPPPQPALQAHRPPPAAAAAGGVSLTAPRPDNERVANEYVEAPFRGRPPPPPPPQGVAARRPRHLALPTPPPHRHHQPVTKQPAAVAALHHAKTSVGVASFSKDLHPAAVGAAPHPAFVSGSALPAAAACAGRPSIVCPECGRCRCEACRRPQRLPQRWLCGGACLVSADTVVDYASCLCCAKALFYHCADAPDGGARCAADPCGCGTERRAARWACLAALSCALPCLWLYWPLRGARRLAEACYARGSRVGCRCRPVAVVAAPTPEKRLLDSSHAELF